MPEFTFNFGIIFKSSGIKRYIISFKSAFLANDIRFFFKKEYGYKINVVIITGNQDVGKIICFACGTFYQHFIHTYRSFFNSEKDKAHIFLLKKRKFDRTLFYFEAYLTTATITPKFPSSWL